MRRRTPELVHETAVAKAVVCAHALRGSALDTEEIHLAITRAAVESVIASRWILSQAFAGQGNIIGTIEELTIALTRGTREVPAIRQGTTVPDTSILVSIIERELDSCGPAVPTDFDANSNFASALAHAFERELAPQVALLDQSSLRLKDTFTASRNRLLADGPVPAERIMQTAIRGGTASIQIFGKRDPRTISTDQGGIRDRLTSDHQIDDELLVRRAQSVALRAVETVGFADLVAALQTVLGEAPTKGRERDIAAFVVLFAATETTNDFRDHTSDGFLTLVREIGTTKNVDLGVLGAELSWPEKNAGCFADWVFGDSAHAKTSVEDWNVRVEGKAAELLADNADTLFAKVRTLPPELESWVNRIVEGYPKSFRSPAGAREPRTTTRDDDGSVAPWMRNWCSYWQTSRRIYFLWALITVRAVLAVSRQ